VDIEGDKAFTNTPRRRLVNVISAKNKRGYEALGNTVLKRIPSSPYISYQSSVANREATNAEP